MSDNEKIERSELEEEAVKAPVDLDKSGKADKKPAKGDDKKAKDEKKSKPGFFARAGKWFKEMRSELKKVQWPGVKTVAKNTGIVIACVIVVGVCIWLFDLLANAVIQALLNLFA